jgi:hypothetical protein
MYTSDDKLIENLAARCKLLFVPEEKNNFQPVLLKSRVVFYFIICLLSFKLLSVLFYVDFSRNIFFADITKTELVNLLNQERVSQNLPALSVNSQLDQAALLKAQDMLQNGYFAHQSPQGISPWFWFKKIGYNYKYAGENLAIGFFESSDVYNAWLNSVSHRDNMLNKNYKEVGTAVLNGNFDGSNVTVVVQVFGSQVQKPEAPQGVPEKENNIPNAPNAENTPNIEEKTPEISPQNVSPETPAVSGNETSVSEPQNSIANSNVYEKYINYVFSNSDYLISIAIYCSLLLVTISFLFLVFVHRGSSRRDLILRSAVILILLFSATFINKESAIQMTPNFLIA